MVRRLLIALHGVLGVFAVAAGGAFVREPDGSALGIEREWLEGLPFRDYRIPGLFLAAVIGSANLLSAAALWRRAAPSALLSLGTGLLLVAWIAVQTAIIGLRHWSQGFWWAVFILVAALAARLVRSEGRD